MAGSAVEETLRSFAHLLCSAHRARGRAHPALFRDDSDATEGMCRVQRGLATPAFVVWCQPAGGGDYVTGVVPARQQAPGT